MDITEVIVEQLKSIESKVDRHGDKLEKLLLVQHTYIKKPTLITISLFIGIIGAIFSVFASQ